MGPTRPDPDGDSGGSPAFGSQEPGEDTCDTHLSTLLPDKVS